MEVKSKRHSSELIRDLNLNRVPEMILDKYDASKIEDFCNQYQEPVYILRDLDSPSGMFFVCKSKEECLKNAKNYPGHFSLAVSYSSYTGKVLLGDIMIDNNRVVIGARNDSASHHRNIYENACINLDTDWDDKRLWKVHGVEKVFNYVLSKNIFNVVVEFVVYDKKVGVNNEDVLIVELRSKY